MSRATRHDERAFRAYILRPNGKPIHPHLFASDHAHISPEIWSYCWRFATVRHPITRLHSLYKLSKTREPDGGMSRLAMGFPHLKPTERRYIIKTYGKNYNMTQWLFELCLQHGWNPWQDVIKGVSIAEVPQVAWLCDGNGRIMVNRIFKMEEPKIIGAALEGIYRKPFATIHANKIVGKRSEVTKSVICWAHHHLKLDFERLEYNGAWR